jgi:polyhydroxyalkanoate synthesis regulator protein
MSVRIKKYVNRKLHAEGDTTYLSMLDLADRAAKDSDIQVVCDRTGRDLTLETLSRALNERLKAYFTEAQFLADGHDKSMPFPVRALTKLIALVPARKRG